MPERATPDPTEARVFTVRQRRIFSGNPAEVMDHWLDPVMRHAILGDGLPENAVRKVAPTEGGEEIVETRWRNQLMGTHHRRYLAIERPGCILCSLNIQFEPVAGVNRQHTAANEMILFKPMMDARTEIVAGAQCISLEPVLIQSVRDSWIRAFDIFENTRSQIEETAQ